MNSYLWKLIHNEATQLETIYLGNTTVRPYLVGGKAKLHEGLPCHQVPGRSVRQQFISIVAFAPPDQLQQDFGGLGGGGVVAV